MNEIINKKYFKGIITGVAGSGKSNIILNIINMCACDYKKTYIFMNSYQPLYYFLEQVKDICIKDNLNDLQDLSKFEKDTLFVIDDEMFLNQKEVINLIIKARPMGLSVLIVSQNFNNVPKIIRMESQFIIISKASCKKYLNMILKEYSLGATEEQFLAMYKYSCTDFCNFFMIDLNTTQDKTYRKNFREYLNINDF